MTALLPKGHSRPSVSGGAWRRGLVPADGKATKYVAAIVCNAWYLKQAVFGVWRIKSCDEQERWRELQFADVCLPAWPRGV
jgi:hypothetical protein